MAQFYPLTMAVKLCTI